MTAGQPIADASTPANDARARRSRAGVGDHQGDVHAALDRALRHLARRDRTVGEVRRHLERGGFAPPAVDAALTELARLGYLNDAGFAERFAADRRTLDGWGAERIARRLHALEVPPDVVEAALGDRDAAAELAAALALLRRRVPVRPADDRARDRALALLVRRGYDVDVAYDAVRAYERES